MVGLPVYLVMVFGARILAIGEFAGLLRRPPRENTMGWVLFAFVLIGPVITLTSAIVPRDMPTAYNNAIWFLVQSKYVAWIPAGAVLMALCRRWHTVLPRVALILLVTAASLPSTIQLLGCLRRNMKRSSLEPASLAALEFLRSEAKAGDVVYSQLDTPLLYTTPLRVPFHPIFTESFTTREEGDKRRVDETEFWDAWRRGELRVDLLARYQVGWILASNKAESEDPWREEVTHVPGCRLDRMFKDKGLVVFRVTLNQRQP
jgi:hypothetical protein